MGKRMGYGLQELDSLGTAALLKDIGHVLLPEAIADGTRAPSQEEARQVRNHPVHGERILKQGSGFAPEVIEAVLQHLSGANKLGRSARRAPRPALRIRPVHPGQDESQNRPEPRSSLCRMSRQVEG